MSAQIVKASVSLVAVATSAVIYVPSVTPRRAVFALHRSICFTQFLDRGHRTRKPILEPGVQYGGVFRFGICSGLQRSQSNFAVSQFLLDLQR